MGDNTTDTSMFRTATLAAAVTHEEKGFRVSIIRNGSTDHIGERLSSTKEKAERRALRTLIKFLRLEIAELQARVDGGATDGDTSEGGAE